MDYELHPLVAHPISMDIRCHLSSPRRGGCFGFTNLQYQGHEPPFTGNIRDHRVGSTYNRDPRSGRMALLKGHANTRQYHLAASAAAVTGIQSDRKRLAVHARQLAIKQDLQFLLRHRRTLLLRLEQTHRRAMEDYVHRFAKMGSPMIHYGNWYKLRKARLSNGQPCRSL